MGQQTQAGSKSAPKTQIPVKTDTSAGQKTKETEEKEKEKEKEKPMIEENGEGKENGRAPLNNGQKELSEVERNRLEFFKKQQPGKAAKKGQKPTK